jgi:hypothetical protein
MTRFRLQHQHQPWRRRAKHIIPGLLGRDLRDLEPLPVT